jgi:tubulysin polyketide synthase-like protein
VSAQVLLEELEQIGIRLRVDGTYLEYEGPEEAVTLDLLRRLREHKPSLMKLLEWESRESEDAGLRGLLVRWSEYPTWIALRDPLTGEWHELKASECLPGVVESANENREKKGRT